MSRRVLVTTVPFGDPDSRPRALLDESGIAYDVLALGRRVTETELAAVIEPYGVLIAGTEPLTARVMAAAPNLKLIARVGIGLDSVDLSEARRRGIAVTYTPDAPSPAVAELTVGLIINLCRHVGEADRLVHAGEWYRFMGRTVDGATIGILGVGRVGTRVIRILRGAFPSVRLLACDLCPDEDLGRRYDVEWAPSEQLFAESDILSVHVPLTRQTRHMIDARQLRSMKTDALLVNTARGPIVNEAALATALREHTIGGAALDVFAHEPYRGELASLSNCLLTCHMASMTPECRIRMEMEATDEAVRFLRGEPLRQPVPESEYLIHEQWSERPQFDRVSSGT